MGFFDGIRKIFSTNQAKEGIKSLQHESNISIGGKNVDDRGVFEVAQETDSPKPKACERIQKGNEFEAEGRSKSDLSLEGDKRIEVGDGMIFKNSIGIQLKLI